MPRRMMFFVPAILIMPLASTLATAQTSVAEPAAEECKAKPVTGRQEGAFASTGGRSASADAGVRESSRNDSHDACTNGARTKNSCRDHVRPTTAGGRLCLAHVRAPKNS